MPRRVVDGIAVVRRGGKFPGLSGARFPKVVRKPTHTRAMRALARLPVPVRYTRRRKLALLSRVDIDATRLLGGDPRLSPRAPYVSGVGDLYFFGAIEYFAKDDRAVMLMSSASPGGYIVVRVAPATPGTRYLLDVRLPALNQPFVRSYDGTVVRADAGGHALFVVTAGAGGSAILSLTVDGISIYNFHDVTISMIG